jgi:two-component system cell cycle response regulator
MSQKPKILIVDDEPRNVKLLAAMLPSEKYECFRAYDGSEALERVAEKAPDLILLDIMMPVTNGFEVTKELKNDPNYRDIPIILVTALDGTDNKIMGLDAGADEFLNKPVNKAELLARIKSLLRLKQYQDQLKTHADTRNCFITPTGKEIPIQGAIDLPSILLVEDDEKDSRLIQCYMHGEPYQIKVSKDGKEAISRAQQEKIDLILLDILLPGMDGFEVCRRLKESEQTQSIQIIAITSLRDMNSKIKGIELGADDYLVKPINRHELKVRVKSLVRKKAYLDGLQNSYEMAVNSAITDKLTGLHNQAYFKHFLDFEIRRSLRQKTPVSILMIDIDDFKDCNDQLGHLAGDQILKEIGGLIKANVREVDSAARYGGEEFAVVLPNTDINEAANIAERLCKVIRNHIFLSENSSPTKKLSVSIGVSSYLSNNGSIDELIQKADSTLYKAKKEGKDKVCVWCEDDIKN